MGWEFVGEDYDTMAHRGLLPLDWRTKAKAIIAFADVVGRWEGLEHLRDGIRLHHGALCFAPPGEWYGGEYVDWSTPDEGIEGWVSIDTDCYIVPEEASDFDDVLVLDLERYDIETVKAACLGAPEGIKLISAGEGWPWMSRKIDDVTVADFR